MPNRDDVLNEQTHKGQGLELDQRIYYTLAPSGDTAVETKQRLQLHRTTKALAILIRRLSERNLLTEDQIDEMLLECLS
jgi:hypothetical protein